MAVIFHRGLAIPLWTIAFVAVALAAPPSPMPRFTVLFGIAVLASAMIATVQWRRTSMLMTSVLIPGAREPGMLTTFGTPASNAPIPDGPSTMAAATIAERQREGGGAPSQRRPARERPQGRLGRMLHQLLTTTRALFPWRFRTNDV